jgi:phage shock protein B
MEEQFMGMLIGGLAIVTLFIGLPWLIFHYVTKWKQAATLTGADEKLLDDLHEVARRLDDRLCTIERIMTAENPNWRQQCLPNSTAQIAEELEQSRSRSRSRSRIPTGE